MFGGGIPIRLTAALRSLRRASSALICNASRLHSAEVLEHGRGFLAIGVAAIECALVERRRDMLLEHRGAQTVLRTADCEVAVRALARNPQRRGFPSA